MQEEPISFVFGEDIQPKPDAQIKGGSVLTQSALRSLRSLTFLLLTKP